MHGMDGLQVGAGEEGAVTPTERARRSDALYYDTESVARRCLCDMIANRESDLEDARAENAKLRGQYEAVIDDYRSEVAKLRELCRYLLPFAESCGAEHPLMRELGVVE